MSGHKYSSITYDPRVNLLFGIRNQQNKAVKKINLLKSQIEGLLQHIEGERSSAKSEATINCLNQCMETVKSEQRNIEETINLLPELPQNPTSVDLTTLQDMGKVISNTERKSNKIESELEIVNKQIYELRGIDKNLIEIEIGLEKISHLLKENDMILQRWEPQEYRDLNEHKERLTKHLFDYKQDLEQKISTSEELKDFLHQAKELITRIEATVLASTEKDKLQEKRIYLVDSLKEVFKKDLGFSIKNDLTYEKEGDLNSRISIVFHSAYYGDVSFYLPLKGEVASDSKISLENCEVEYKKVSRLLKERFGLNSEFKRELQTEKPEDKYETAMPQPEVLRTMERG